jgi:hypothetical protein
VRRSGALRLRLSQMDLQGDARESIGVTDDQGRALSRAGVPTVMAVAKRNLDYLRSVIREAYQEA